MSNLRKLGHKILSEKHPDLEERFYELDYLYGKLIFTTRIRKGLTQAQLADMCGCSPKTIHRVEGGNDNINMSTYKMIFNKLEISLPEIVEYMSKKAQLGKQIDKPDYVHN
jgi:transcriptional regulator with XRE-family HTH domain